VAKAEDPEQRQRAVDKLEREAAALGRLEAAQEITSAQPVTGAMRELALELGKIAYDDRVTKYVTRVRVAAELAWPRLSAEQ
jgi:predicted negative regulator of RcsB-dependent stress response